MTAMAMGYSCQRQCVPARTTLRPAVKHIASVPGDVAALLTTTLSEVVICALDLQLGCTYDVRALRFP